MLAACGLLLCCMVVVVSASEMIFLPSGNTVLLTCFNPAKQKSFSMEHNIAYVWYQHELKQFSSASYYMSLNLPKLPAINYDARGDFAYTEATQFIQRFRLSKFKCIKVDIIHPEKRILDFPPVVERTVTLYEQPTIYWLYFIRPSTLENLRDELLSVLEEFCFVKTTLSWLGSPCMYVDVSPECSKESSFCEILLRITPTITTALLHEDPMQSNSPLYKQHADEKIELDRRLIEICNIEKHSIKLFCPAGQSPPLSEISLAQYKDSNPRHALEENRRAVSQIRLLCKHCEAGRAASKPYRMSDCAKCGNGKFRDEYWPAYLGCNSCEDGYHHGMYGSTSDENCRHRGGAVLHLVDKYLKALFMPHQEAIIQIVKSVLYGKTLSLPLIIDTYSAIEIYSLIAALLLIFAIVGLISLFIYRVLLLLTFLRMQRARRRILVRLLLNGQLNLSNRILRSQTLIHALVHTEVDEEIIKKIKQAYMDKNNAGDVPQTD